jgi:chromosome segregation ATPase
MEHNNDLNDDIKGAVMTGDAEKLLKLLAEHHKQGLVEWTRQCSEMRERIEELKMERERAQAELRHLEPILRDASEAHAQALAISDEKRIQAQEIQLKLGGLDSRLHILKEDITDAERELREVFNSRLQIEV